MNLTSIYGLYDPRNSAMIMYVGKGNEKRARSHWREYVNHGRAVNALVRIWFDKLRLEDVSPSYRMLDLVIPASDWQWWEKFYISLWRDRNPDLCNVSSGGNYWPLTTERRREIGRVNGKLYGAVGGHRLKELYPNLARECGMSIKSQAALTAARTHEHQVAAGRSGGFALASSCDPKERKAWGSKGAAGLRKKYSKEQLSRWAKKGSENGGGWAAMHRNFSKYQVRSFGSKGAHVLWHVKRGITKEGCQFCSV